jgi:hypothetical protein
VTAENNNPKSLEQRKAILKYLETHPHAADTLEGIVNWWLPLQRHQDALEEIEKILEELVEDGQVVKKILPDKKVIYACATGRTAGTTAKEDNDE